MDSTLVMAARWQFGFTLLFHYLFPIITMGLGVFLAYYATAAYITGAPRYRAAAQFWTRIFALTFAVGVVTGIPLEFQFGTNWSQFSAFAGGVFGFALPLEGTFAFFLESGFLGVLLFGRGRVPAWLHWLSSLAVAGGALLSGYFITAANAWMQHPVGYRAAANGQLELTSWRAVLFNPYLGWQYAHVINGALLAGAFLLGAVGAFYLLLGRHREFACDAVRVGVAAGLVLALFQLYPTGDGVGHNVTQYQPVKLAAMEGEFATEAGAPLAILGMPDTQRGRLLDPLEAPRLLSFLAYGSFGAKVQGLDQIPRDLWPPVELTYYAYHIMAGLGTLFIALMGLGAALLPRDRLFRSRWYLWMLLLAAPFPLIANEAGWIVAEVGRQPWIIYGLLRTSQGVSPNVSAGETVFTLLGFAGLYLLLALLYLLLVGRVIASGPEPVEGAAA
ncbi:MAG TPA: cytochrome ubiquinol oxidase subunit I [Terriglobales bacterium]|nr:cytochrome ubiquinol oxidase subunit I [Terriglobales bacterium]